MRPTQSKDLERRYASGEPIVVRGSAGGELFIVREGTVLLSDAPGEAARLLGPGDVFGEIAAILGRPHASDAVAEGEVLVLALDTAQLNRLCAESPEFAVRLMRLLALRAARELVVLENTGSGVDLDEAEVVLENTAEAAAAAPADAASAAERSFAAALLRCSEGDEPPVAVRGRLAELAAEAGVEMLEAYACLQRLLDRRLLRLVDDQLSILAPSELQALAGE